MSERQIIRLRKGVSEKGQDAVRHGNKGRPPSTTINEKNRQQIVGLYKEKYYGANFQHFSELLAENEGIRASTPTIKSILNAAGIISPKVKRKPKKHIRRKRREYEGSLVQTDATAHDLFGTGETSCLHGIVDDATGKILGLYITKNECLEGYFAVFEQMIENFGIPASVYADRHTIFVSPKTDKLTVEDELAGIQVNDTQLGRAIRELGVTLIKARSPQAKGRIERLWGTLHDRLVIEFRINGVTRAEEANRFFNGYIPRYNRRFAVETAEATSLFVLNNYDLTGILCIREKRKLDAGGAFSFYGHYFVINGDIPPKTQIEIAAHREKGIFALYKGQRYAVSRIDKPKRQKVKTHVVERSPYVPQDSHYYKHGKESCTHYSSEYTDAEILTILDELFSKSVYETIVRHTSRRRIRAAGFADSF